MHRTGTPRSFPLLGTGVRYSTYGPAYDPGADYWARVAQEMSDRFPGSTPEMIWTVSEMEGKGTRLTFPGAGIDPFLLFSEDDNNETALTLFDRLGYHVWLQVEPGEALVEKLIDLTLSRYGDHLCVVGVGVDVEWHHSGGTPEGEPVSDSEAASWLAAAQAYGEQYRLFIKHWETSMLPPTLREGMVFVNDSQEFNSLEDMLSEFTAWGRYYSPSPVAFQIGYPADKPWWGELTDPVRTIGEAILAAVPNTTGLYWVDFTALEVFKP